jgi:predicted transposase YdaD
MLDYWVRLYRTYEAPVTQFVIVLCETRSEIPTEFRAPNTWHRYQVIKMWEQDPEPFLNTAGLLPLATLARSERPAALLEEVAARVMQVEAEGERRELVGCATMLAGLRFQRELIHRLLQEDLMEESVIYQEAVQRGLQQGIQQGELKTVLRLLKHRCGPLAPAVEARVSALNAASLDALSVALLDFNQASDLESWLVENA